MNKRLESELKYQTASQLINKKEEQIKPVYESVWANNEIMNGYIPGMFAFALGGITFTELTEDVDNKYTKAVSYVGAGFLAGICGTAGLAVDAVVTTGLTAVEILKFITHLPNIIYRSVKNSKFRKDINQLKETIVNKKEDTNKVCADCVCG